MTACYRTAVLLILASSLLQAQLSIENPKHLDLSEPHTQALFLSTLRVMEKEFHVPNALENKFRMKLVLGQTPERFTIDDPAGNGTLYLERWNEIKFTATTMRLAIQQLLVPERRQRMMDAILRQAQEIAPVTAADLRREKVEIPQPKSLDNCLERLTNAAVSGLPCRHAEDIRQPQPMRLR